MRIWHLCVAVLVAAGLLTVSRYREGRELTLLVVCLSAWVSLGLVGASVARDGLDRTRQQRGLKAFLVGLGIRLSLFCYSLCAFLIVFWTIVGLSNTIAVLLKR
jgi:hypothetical protein